MWGGWGEIAHLHCAGVKLMCATDMVERCGGFVGGLGGDLALEIAEA